MIIVRRSWISEASWGFSFWISWLWHVCSYFPPWPGSLACEALKPPTRQCMLAEHCSNGAHRTKLLLSIHASVSEVGTTYLHSRLVSKCFSLIIIQGGLEYPHLFGWWFQTFFIFNHRGDDYLLAHTFGTQHNVAHQPGRAWGHADPQSSGA